MSDASIRHLASKNHISPSPSSSRRSALPPAHASALALVRQALSKLRTAQHLPQEFDRLRFQVMSEIVPSLKLVLPLPIPRAGHNHGGNTRSGGDMHKRSRFVAVPTSRIASLQNASDDQVSQFLESIAPHSSGTSDHSKESGSAFAAISDPLFELDEVVLMMQLAVKFDVKDVDLTLRLFSEFERLLVLQHQSRKARRLKRQTNNLQQADKSVPVAPKTEVLEPQAPSPSPQNGTVKFSALDVSRFVFFASCIGFLEDHNLQALLRSHVMPMLRRSKFTSRQLVHLAIGLMRFSCHKEPAFDLAMEQIAFHCQGTSVRALDDELSSASQLPVLQCRISSEASIAHPSLDLTADVVLELVSCMALSVHRSRALTAAITYRLLFLCEGAQVEDHALAKRQIASPSTAAPTAEQLHFICGVFRKMEAPNTILETALLSLASKKGIILNHGGDTREEEGATFNEFASDFVKL